MIDEFPKSKEGIDISFINHQSILFAHFKRFQIFLSFSWIFNSYSLSFSATFQSKLRLEIIILSQQTCCLSISTFFFFHLAIFVSLSFYFHLILSPLTLSLSRTTSRHPPSFSFNYIFLSTFISPPLSRRRWSLLPLTPFTYPLSNLMIAQFTSCLTNKSDLNPNLIPMNAISYKVFLLAINLVCSF